MTRAGPILVIHRLPNEDIKDSWPMAGFKVRFGPLDELFAEQDAVGYVLEREKPDEVE